MSPLMQEEKSDHEARQSNWQQALDHTSLIVQVFWQNEHVVAKDSLYLVNDLVLGPSLADEHFDHFLLFDACGALRVLNRSNVLRRLSIPDALVDLIDYGLSLLAGKLLLSLNLLHRSKFVLVLTACLGLQGGEPAV